VLTFARSDGRVLLTLNRKHFVRLHSRSRHAGIIACTFDPDFVALAYRIHQVLGQQANLSQQLIRINRPNTEM